MSDLATFLRETDEIIAAVPRLHRDASVAIAAQAYEAVIRRSPVVTGAYRAENVVTEGDPLHATRFLYESPNRPGPDTLVNVHAGQPLDAPNAGDAKAAMANVPPFREIGVLNQRFYSHFVEAKHGVYQAGEDLVRTLAERVKIEDPRFR